MSCLALLLAAIAHGQMDTEKRLQLEAGFERGVGAPGPAAPYLFLYLNQPRVLGSSTTLRMAIAPVYLDAELGIEEALPLTDAGLGFSGGGFAFGQTEVRRGVESAGQSFVGHGGGPSAALYPRLGAIGPIPLNAVLRAAGSYTRYERTSRTERGFALPPGGWSASTRGGLRFGGRAPGIGLDPAAELSAWLERRYTERAGVYGFGDRTAERRVDLYWMRLFLSVPLKDGSHLAGGLGAGGGERVDRFSAFRLGGMLTQNAEFPLPIPGYFSQEIAARRYSHFWARGGKPLPDRRFSWTAFAALATATPAPGTDPGGRVHSGLGAGLAFIPKKAALRGDVSYGWSPTASRGRHHGAHGVALMLELNFRAVAPRRPKNTQQGLRWLFGTPLLN